MFNTGNKPVSPGSLIALFHAVQYAGNVLVYGAMSPCDGDWFGGVNDSNAAAFLNGVINAEVCYCGHMPSQTLHKPTSPRPAKLLSVDICYSGQACTVESASQSQLQCATCT